MYPAWELMGLQPARFAGTLLLAGDGGSAPASAIKDVPLWAFCAANDNLISPDVVRSLVLSLRRAGGKPLYRLVGQ